MADLPQNFVNLQLFPVAIFREDGIEIRANFGKEPWTFDLNQLPKIWKSKPIFLIE